MKKPQWLNKKLDINQCGPMKETLRSLGLNTVCEAAGCPNMTECFNLGIATFLILGDVCTRECAFCGVAKGKTKPWDIDEPMRIKEAVEASGLKFVVVTSPTRDDLADGGALAFVETVKVLKNVSGLKVEILVPDFGGKESAIKLIADCSADVVAHNIETAPSLYIKVRKGALYGRSLDLLKKVKQYNKSIFTKSGLMLGLGETFDEVVETLKDLRRVDCDFLTLGQYLAPSLKHYPVARYVEPAEFAKLADIADQMGFKDVKSSPYTRSSYLADKTLNS
jgi:lipoic acid synthetase